MYACMNASVSLYFLIVWNADHSLPKLKYLNQNKRIYVQIDRLKTRKRYTLSFPSKNSIQNCK